jgi:hypothetical protein
MSLLSLKELRAIQRIGVLGMNVDVEIRHRERYAKDPDNPYGDEDVTYRLTTTMVKGWLVTKPTERVEVGEGQVRVIATHQLRVPVGTSILPGDDVICGGETFTVIDATNEQSWPEWTLAFLRGHARR